MSTTTTPGVKRGKVLTRRHRPRKHPSGTYGGCPSGSSYSMSAGRTAQSETKHEAVRIRGLWSRPFKRKASLDLALLEARILARLRNLANDARSKPQAPTRRVVAQEVFTGRVDNICNGVAFLTLFPKDGEPLAAQWSPDDLAKKSIGKSDLFELTMTDSGEAVTSSFRKTLRQPIPDGLWTEIQKVKEAYSDFWRTRPMAPSSSGQLKILRIRCILGGGHCLALAQRRLGCNRLLRRFTKRRRLESGAPTPLLSRCESTGVPLLYTHPHEDHFMGMSRLVRDFDIEAFWGFGGLQPPDFALLKTYFEADAATSGLPDSRDRSNELSRLFDEIEAKGIPHNTVNPKSLIYPLIDRHSIEYQNLGTGTIRASHERV